MAGSLKPDPAVERWVEMRHSLYQNFRWTGKSTRQVTVWGLVVPVALYYLASSVEGKYDFRGVGRDDSITRK